MNKENLLKKKKLLVTYLLLSTVSLNGCNSNNNINTSENTAYNTTENITTEYKTEYTSEDITTEYKTENTTENITTECTTENTTETKETKTIDEEIIDVINNEKNNIEFYINSDDVQNAKKYGKEFFIKFVDFIFYDKEVNGIKYNDLKEETKEDIYNTFCDIDALIMMVSPDYKNDIGEKYEVVKDFTSNAYYSSLDKIKEAIGEDNYNKIGEIKDGIKEKASDGMDMAKDGAEKAKTYIKDKYENFRDSN